MANTYPDYLAWVDIETTHLEPNKGSIWELGIILTDGRLNELNRASWVLRADRENLGRVSDWSLVQHAKSGLLIEALASGLDAQTCAAEAVKWLGSRSDWQTEGTVPMAGASVHFDRAWLKHHMPKLEAWFYYGNLDVSSVEKLARLWWPEVPQWEDRGLHRAQVDNEDAIEELRYYVERGVLVRPLATAVASGVAIEHKRD